MGWRILCLALLALLATSQAEAEVVRIRIDRVEPFADGTAFGETGAYERVTGTAFGEIDPTDPRNPGIAGLDQAPRNARGRVEYEADLFLLRPADPDRGNHRLLFEVLNRGRKLMLQMMLQVVPGPDVRENDPRTLADAGDGFLFRQGYTLAWAGWDADAPRDNGGMGATLPALLVALDEWASDGKPPPPNAIPRLADDTLVPAGQLNFPPIPGLAIAGKANPVFPKSDWVRPRPTQTPYRVLVPAVDKDGNEVAGIRLPDIAVPAATYTGWNLYAAPFPTDALCDRDGTRAPFAATDPGKTEGDPRASLQARYGSKAGFIARTRAAAQDLVDRRLLLAEDIPAYVAHAEAVADF